MKKTLIVLLIILQICVFGGVVSIAAEINQNNTTTEEVVENENIQFQEDNKEIEKTEKVEEVNKPEDKPTESVGNNPTLSVESKQTQEQLNSTQEISEGTYEIYTMIEDTKVVDVSEKSIANSANIQIWDRTNVKNQKFIFEKNDDRYIYNNCKSFK